jgi:hypothetical protein
MHVAPMPVRRLVGMCQWALEREDEAAFVRRHRQGLETSIELTPCR